MTEPLRAGVYGRQSRGKTKSVDEQVAECSADVRRQGWTAAGVYTDTVSASRYGRKARGDFARLLADVSAGALDVLCVWAPDRADRELESWARLLNLCRAGGVLIRVTDHDRTYDLNQPRDWRSLAEDGLDAAYFSEKLSRAVTRGVAGSAKSGRPAMGPCPYGYRRTYDPTTGELRGQEPDPATAPIVKEIVSKVAASVPSGQIVADLNAGGVPAPGGTRWYRQRIRMIALNPVYIGMRRHRAHGKNAHGTPELYAGGWEPIVDQATHYAAVRVLADPARFVNRRPGRQKHLLTYLAGSVECYRGHPLTVSHGAYTCQTGCVTADIAELDGYVYDLLLARFADPEWQHSLLTRAETDDAGVLAARAEVDRLHARLRQWERAATEDDDIDPASFANVVAGIKAKIRSAERELVRRSMPPAMQAIVSQLQIARPDGTVLDLRTTTGRDLVRDVQLIENWWGLSTPARRDVIRDVLELKVHSGGKGQKKPVAQRVTYRFR